MTQCIICNSILEMEYDEHFMPIAHVCPTCNKRWTLDQHVEEVKWLIDQIQALTTSLSVIEGELGL